MSSTELMIQYLSTLQYIVLLYDTLYAGYCLHNFSRYFSHVTSEHYKSIPNGHSLLNRHLSEAVTCST